MKGFVAGGLALVLMGAAGQAQAESADALRAFLYEGKIAEGIESLSQLPDDPEAVFGVGLLTFVSGIEDFSRALYRHGFDPMRGAASSLIFGLPNVPERTTPAESLTYEDVRTYLEDLVETLDAAHDLLLVASENTDFAIELDVMQFRIDVDGDGVASEDEAIGAFLAQAARMANEFDLEAGLEELPTTFAFDAADAIWLAGYSQILAINADFALAHDFEAYFNTFLHRFFPDAGLPMSEFSPAESLFFDSESDGLLADTLAGIHTMSWPVIDRERFARVPERGLAVIALSRRNWEAILAETDDHLEFIPSPYQTPVHPDMAVSKAMVTAWHEALESAERVLTGDLLLPHWRFGGVGFDLSRYFESAERTDIVLLLTGHDALPFLAEGEIVSEDNFLLTNQVFGGAIWGYALWFN